MQYLIHTKTIQIIQTILFSVFEKYMIIERHTQSYFLINLPFHLSNMKPQVGEC